MSSFDTPRDFIEFVLWNKLYDEYQYTGKVSKSEINFLLDNTSNIPSFVNPIIKQALNNKIFKSGDSKYSFMEQVAIGVSVEKLRRKYEANPELYIGNASPLEQAKCEVAEELGYKDKRAIEKIIKNAKPTIDQAISVYFKQDELKE